MNLFVKIIVTIAAFIAVVTGVIIASQVFYPMEESISDSEHTSNENVSGLMDLYLWIFGISMVVLVGTPAIWYLFSTSQEEYERQRVYEEYQNRRF